MEYQQNQGGGTQGGPHWGYSGGWGSAPAPAPPRATKRAHSDSDDDAFSESSSKDAQSPSDNTNDSCQLLTRKRRRGVIEKKRRDRINTSLSELKRLVPTAYEKQGSAKLEKAEILQLTVDHLKMLHAKGVDSFAYDPQRYAMDYHNIGFRECASEVARYLVSCEGLDIQDPLRLRLMSHLQCFAAQRELAAKSCSTPWGYGSGPQYPAAPLHPPAAPLANPLPQTSTHEASHVPHSYGEPSCIPRHDPPASSAPTTVSTALPAAAPLAPSGAYSAHYPPVPPHYPPPYQQPPAPTHHQYPQTSSKPYRPWGAELAY